MREVIAVCRSSKRSRVLVAAVRTTTGTTPSSENAMRDPMRTIGTRLSRADRIS